MVEGWFSFHLWEDNPFLNGIPKVLWFNTNFSESESFRSSIIWHQFLWTDDLISFMVGWHFCPHGELSDLFIRYLLLRGIFDFLTPYPPTQMPIYRFLRFLPLRRILRFLDTLPFGSGTDADQPISSFSLFAWNSSISPSPTLRPTSLADRPISSVSSFASNSSISPPLTLRPASTADRPIS